MINQMQDFVTEQTSALTGPIQKFGKETPSRAVVMMPRSTALPRMRAATMPIAMLSGIAISNE